MVGHELSAPCPRGELSRRPVGYPPPKRAFIRLRVVPYVSVEAEGEPLARVLVIDDSPSVRALLTERLCAQGYEVEEAATGESGAERAIAAPPDVIVTDLVM